MARPRANDYAQKRRRVLAAATELFARNGYAITIDNGWKEVAGTALTFVRRFD